MTEPTAHPSPDTMLVPITVGELPPGLLDELDALLESKLSERPLSLGWTTLKELRLDGDGWSPTVVTAAKKAAAVGAAAHAAGTRGNKQPHYYVTIRIAAVWE